MGDYNEGMDASKLELEMEEADEGFASTEPLTHTDAKGKVQNKNKFKVSDFSVSDFGSTPPT